MHKIFTRVVCVNGKHPMFTLYIGYIFVAAHISIRHRVNRHALKRHEETRAGGSHFCGTMGFVLRPKPMIMSISLTTDFFLYKYVLRRVCPYIGIFNFRTIWLPDYITSFLKSNRWKCTTFMSKSVPSKRGLGAKILPKVTFHVWTKSLSSMVSIIRYGFWDESGILCTGISSRRELISPVSFFYYYFIEKIYPKSCQPELRK